MTPYYADDAVTIYHGDCREIMPHVGPVDMIFTDPPFGHGNMDGDLQASRVGVKGARKRPPEPIRNDREEATPLFARFTEIARDVLRHGGCCCCCCCCGGGPDPQFARWSLILDGPLSFKHMVIWDKTARGPGIGWHYRRDYETVLIAEKRGAPTRWRGGSRSNIVRIAPPLAREHPNEKPVDLAGCFIGLHSAPGDLILDPFMGSGTTLRAAKDLGRKAIGIEIEERYCEIAAKRMMQEVLPI